MAPKRGDLPNRPGLDEERVFFPNNSGRSCVLSTWKNCPTIIFIKPEALARVVDGQSPNGGIPKNAGKNGVGRRRNRFAAASLGRLFFKVFQKMLP
jgi:hypothetical protein